MQGLAVANMACAGEMARGHALALREVADRCGISGAHRAVIHAANMGQRAGVLAVSLRAHSRKNGSGTTMPASHRKQRKYFAGVR